MEYNPPNIQTRQALEELQRYLSDQLPPLMVQDSIALLIERPPELVALQVQAWTTAQYRAHRSSVPVSSYLFHAIKKIHLMGEYRLVPREAIAAYLEALSQIVLERYCPEGERQLLSENLSLIGQTDSSVAEGIEILHWPGEKGPSPMSGGPGGGGGGGGAGLTDDAAKGLRRFSLMVEQLSRMPQVPVFGAATMPESQGNLISQILTTAAVNSHSSSELSQYLSRLREAGMEPRTDEAFRILAGSLPGWGVLVPQAAGPLMDRPRAEGPLEAMRKLITLSEDVDEKATRFTQMMQAAIEQFNRGELGAAVAMFDLAQRIIGEVSMHPAVLKGILHRASEALDAGRLSKLSEKPEKHALLRRVLAFFPDLTPRGLLDQLQDEPKRDRRRLLLALLEVHADAARRCAYEDLKLVISGQRTDISPFHLRNLVFLLRRIPRPAPQPSDEELEFVIKLSGREFPPIVRKEALAVLGGMKHDRSESTLLARAREFEEILLRPAEPKGGRQEVLLMLDRAIYALARYGTTRAWRTVVDHGLRNQPQLGDTLARVANLAGTDLSSDRGTVDRLLKCLKEQLPLKVLGFSIARGHEAAVHVIKALSSTPTPEVHHALDEIARRFPDTEFAQAAAKAIAGFGTPSPTAEQATTTLAGDLELFGLPNLLQSLAESSVTGTLSLSDPNGEQIGSLAFEAGRLRNCHVGALRGEAALYQLFERPTPGSFVLRSRRDGGHETEQTEPPRDVLPLILEAVRRHDELRKARALVPDGSHFKPTGTKPTRTSEEKDVAFLRTVWGKVSSGASPEQCEASIAADAYRIRSVMAHWLEEGALQRQ